MRPPPRPPLSPAEVFRRAALQRTFELAAEMVAAGREDIAFDLANNDPETMATYLSDLDDWKDLLAMAGLDEARIDEELALLRKRLAQPQPHRRTS